MQPKYLGLHRAGRVVKEEVETEMVVSIGSPAGFSDQRSIMLVVENLSVQTRAVEILQRMGCNVLSLNNLDSAMNYLRRTAVDLVIVDADCCRSHYAETIDKIGIHSPLSRTALIVGWWDERVLELAGICQHFVYRPFRPKQIYQLLVDTIFYPSDDLPDSA